MSPAPNFRRYATSRATKNGAHAIGAVWLDGRKVGEVRHDRGFGYSYAPKGSRVVSAAFPTLAALLSSLKCEPTNGS